jgi:molybdopterin-containing oxidoreductase family membrane subunit
MAWYGAEPAEKGMFWNRLFGTYWWAGWVMLTCNGIIPMCLWFRRFRNSIPALFCLSIFINIGMWFERYVIIVSSLAHEYEPFAWGQYKPAAVEMTILLGSFCWFGFWFLLFLRLMPPVAIAELKEVVPPAMRRQEVHHG